MKKFTFKRSTRPKQSFRQRIEHWPLEKLTRYFMAVGVIVAVASGYIWFSRVYMTDERQFWLAIQNSMATPSVTRTIEDGGTGNLVVQRQRFHYNSQRASESKVNYAQKSATVETIVETEGRTFPDAQFSRYTQFETTETRPDGREPNLDSILGLWEGTYFDEAQKEQAKTYAAQQLITLGIFGNFDTAFRTHAMEALKGGAYKISSSNITFDEVDGQKLMLVQVDVYLKKYVQILQESLVRLGYGEYSPLNPDSFSDEDRRVAVFAINQSNNTVVGIQYGNRQEKYSGYGIVKKVEYPEATFEAGELQKIVEEEIQDAL